jgi:hypothetical protein
VECLSQEWLDETRAAAGQQLFGPGVDARVQYVVTGAPRGDVRYVHVLEGGRLAECRLGAVADADVTVTVPYPTWVLIDRGELDPSVAFMRGAVKTAGDPGRWLEILAATRTPAYREVQTEVRARTDYPDT